MPHETLDNTTNHMLLLSKDKNLARRACTTHFALLHHELLAVVLRPSLRHGQQNRLMVAGAAECANTIVARGKTSGHGGTETALAVSGVVDAFEESELRRVERLLGCQ